MGLKELRLKHSYSQEKLAELSRLSTRTIQRIEKEHKAGLESIKALASVFEMTAEELKQNIEAKEQTKENFKRYDSFLEFLVKNSKTYIFLVANIIFLIINLLTSSYLWFFYPLIIWGFFHIKALLKEYKNTKS